MPRWAITQPRQGRGASVVQYPRLVILDVPEGAGEMNIWGWLDDVDYQLDSAVREDEWSANVQLAAEDCPTVRWTGGEIT